MQRHCIDQGNVHHVAVFKDFKPLGRDQMIRIFRKKSAGVCAGSHARDGALDHAGEHIVGAGGNWDQGNVAAPLGHGAIRAVTAQGDDALHAEIPHGLYRQHGIQLDPQGQGVHREEADVVSHMLVLAVHAVERGLDDAVILLHVIHSIHVGTAEAHDDAADDVHLVAVIHGGGISHQPADVLAGGGVRYNSYRVHALTPRCRP